MMREMHNSSPRKSVSVEQLLQLKRLEAPSPDFWEGFERELKQKQLQALMRPSRWERFRSAVCAPKLTVLAPLSAATIICVAGGLIAFSFFADMDRGFGGGMDTASVELPAPNVDPVAVVESEAEKEMDALETVEAEEAPAARSPDPRFVEDVLRPKSESIARESFRTVAETETFVGGSDSSAYYVVNAFTVVAEPRNGGDVTLEF